MGSIVDKFNTTYADGPAGAPANPEKFEIRAIGALIEAADAALAATSAALDTRLTATEAVADDALATADAALAIAQDSAVPPLASIAAFQTTVLPAATYANGALGVGATITANANGALTSAYFDGVTPTAAMRLWVVLEGARNGIYTVTQVGTVGTPFVLTRATDADVAAELGLCNALVSGGTLHKNSRYQCQQKAANIVVGTTALTFALISEGFDADFATNAEMIAGTATDKLGNPENVHAAINDYVDRPADADATKFGFALVDDDDAVIIGVRPDGNMAVPGLEVGEDGDLTIETVDLVSDYALVVADEDERIAFGIRNDGTVVYDSSGSGSAPVSSGTFDYDINGIVQYGQSNAMGSGGVPLLSTTQLYTALMFGGGGIRPWVVGSDPAVIYQAFVPLVETAVETGVAGICDMIMERAIAENGISPFSLGYQIQGSSAAQSGRPLSDLAKGGTYYPRFLEQVEYAALRGADLNKTFALRCVPWIQGEADTVSSVDPTTYKNALKQMRTDMQADIAAYVPNNPLVQLLVAQVTSHRYYDRTPAIALAQLDACAEDANLHMVAPTYFLEYTDGVHSNGVSKRWMGAYFGLAYKRLFIDQEEWVEFRCVETVRQGRAATLRFEVPEPPIVFDTEWITDPGNYGIVLRDDLGVQMTIDSISVVSPTRFRIVASADIPAGATVQYAFGADIAAETQSGRFTGSRGCLRDSQGDRIVFDPNGIDRPMHNWCPIFQTTLA